MWASILSKLFNHCQECGCRIPWRKRAHLGNTYKPVICDQCHRLLVSAIYGSETLYRAAITKAAAEELRASEHLR